MLSLVSTNRYLRVSYATRSFRLACRRDFPEIFLQKGLSSLILSRSSAVFVNLGYSICLKYYSMVLLTQIILTSYMKSESDLCIMTRSLLLYPKYRSVYMSWN